jgi:hypothetical protein
MTEVLMRILDDAVPVARLRDRTVRVRLAGLGHYLE